MAGVARRAAMIFVRCFTPRTSISRLISKKSCERLAIFKFEIFPKLRAITVDKATGAKVVNESTCVGCKVCTIACPFGTVNYVQETGKVQKCDLCGGEPACAEACPTGAITYIDANWTGLNKMEAWADKLGNQPTAA